MTWRGRNRKDLNQTEIAAALEAIGASTLDTSQCGGGAPDLLVGFRGRNFWLEVKNRKTHYGRQGQSKSQQAFAAKWQDKIHVVHTADDALRVIGAITEEQSA